jgi:hypothetical protein
MVENSNRARSILGYALVASAVIAAGIAFTMRTKVEEVKTLYVDELQSRLESAKKREAYMRSLEFKLRETNLSNAVDMYSAIAHMRTVMKEAVSLAVEQQEFIEFQIKGATKDGKNK